MGHIHDQGIQKNGLTKKLKTIKDYFESLLHLLFHVVGNWYMTITRMMSY
jgi:hypothetical protein